MIRKNVENVCLQEIKSHLFGKDKVFSVSAVSPRLALCYLADGKSALADLLQAIGDF